MKRQSLRAFFATSVFATSLLASSNAMAQSPTMLLNIDGVVGESQVENYKGAIDLVSWSWGQSTGARTSRGAQPDLCIQDLHFVKEIGAASSTLITYSVLGQVAREARLVVRRSGESGPVDVLRLTMHNVTVTSYQTGGSSGGGLPMDQVSLHFESMDGMYYKQNFDGSTTGTPFSITTGAANCR